MNEMYDQGVISLASSKDLLHIQRHNSHTAPLTYLLAVVRLKSNLHVPVAPYKYTTLTPDTNISTPSCLRFQMPFLLLSGTLWLQLDSEGTVVFCGNCQKGLES